MAELITWCRIMRVGPACATPCDDCRVTSRRYSLAGQSGLIKARTLDEIHAEIDDEATPPHLLIVRKANTDEKEPEMTSQTPRYTIQELIADRFTIMDAQTGQGIVYVCDRDEAQAKADAMNKLDALGVQAGDTVVGLTTGSHPRQITVTVDRSPWLSGISNAILSDGRSVEAVQLDSLRIIKSATSHEDEQPLTIDAEVLRLRAEVERLQAANDRAWEVVQLLRYRAMDRGESPYSDPIGQLLSAALVGYPSHEEVRAEMRDLTSRVRIRDFIPKTEGSTGA